MFTGLASSSPTMPPVGLLGRFDKSGRSGAYEAFARFEESAT
jgi:hypothetical protein